MRVRIWWELLKDTFRAWNEDSVPRLGAALAYYALFSIAPLLLILIGIAGLVFGERAAEGEIAIEMETALGRPMAEATQEILKSARSAGNGVAVTIVGGVSLFL